MLQLCVITNVGPDAYADEAARRPTTHPDVDHYIPGEYMAVLIPAFKPGEILIVQDAQEVSGHQRRIDRWNIKYQLFSINDIEDAIKLAKRSTPDLNAFERHILNLKVPCTHPKYTTDEEGLVSCTKCGRRLDT